MRLRPFRLRKPEIRLTTLGIPCKLGVGPASLTLLLIVLAVFATVPSTAVGASLRVPGRIAGHPATSYITVAQAGIAPTSIALSWNKSRDYCFTSYTIQYSSTSSNGPWATLAVSGSISATQEYVYGLTPGTTYWWQVVDTDCVGTQAGNALQATQPEVAVLNYALPTESSVTFTWGNPAQYGGLLSFENYQVYESENGAVAASVVTITDSTTTSFAVNGLSSSTSYSFFLKTTDECNACSTGLLPSYSDSLPISFSTPAPLSATASTSAPSIDVDQRVTLTCAAAGGLSPIAYSWSFGDGSTGIGSPVSHTYSSAGQDTAICTARDADGVEANSGVSVSVISDPQVGSLIASSNDPLLGQAVTIVAMVTGGSGGLTFSWTGLPPGCVSSDLSTVTCTPTSTGTFDVALSVTDANGYAANSSPLTLTVAPSFLGFPQTEGYELVGAGVGGLVVLAAIAAVILSNRRKRRKGSVPAGQSPPPP